MQQPAGTNVTLPRHIILPWAEQSLLLLLNCALEEMQQFFGLTRPAIEPTTIRSRGEHASHYNTEVVLDTKKENEIEQNKLKPAVYIVCA